MKLHPLHTQEMLDSWALMNPRYDPHRRTGRSTRQALRYIASSMALVGVPVQVIDHHYSAPAHKHLLYMIADIVNRMGWIGFTFNAARNTITFGESK